MAEQTTLDDVITALKEQNDEKKTEDILNRMADQSASLAEQLAASEKANQERFEESEKQKRKSEEEARKARVEAAADALNAENESKLTGKDKDPKSKSRLGGLMDNTKNRIAGAGGGSIGLGLGRYAIGAGLGIAGVGAFLSGENAQKAGEAVNNFITGVKGLVDKAGIEVPKLTDMYTKGNEILGKTLDGIIAIQEGDFESFKESVPALATSTAILTGTYRKMMGSLDKGVRGAGSVLGNAVKSVGTGLSNAKNFVTGRTPPVLDGNERMQRNARTTKSLTGAQKEALKAKGFKIDKAGNLMEGGKRIKADAADKALKGVGASTSTSKSKIVDAAQKRVSQMAGSDNKAVAKAGKLAQFIGPKGAKILGGMAKLGKRIPILGQLLGVGTLGMIAVNEDLTLAQKTKEMAKVFGGLGGATLGAIAGSAMGTALIPIPGLGTAIGGIGGGIFGSMFGEEIAEALAGAIMGDAPTPSSEMTKLVADTGGTIKASGSSPSLPASGGSPSSSSIGKGARGVGKTTGNAISAGQTAYQSAQSSAGGGSTNVIAPQSTTNNIGGANAMVTGGLTPVDPFTAGTS
jgi:hypothetical protein